jgi:hypothetical protein
VPHRFDKTLVAHVCEGVVVDVEIVLGHDPKGANGGRRAAVLAVQFVDSVAVHNQLPVLAARQVQVVHQAVARLQAKRRLDGAGNRTINMDVGALRQVLTRFKQWRNGGRTRRALKL